MKPHKATSSDVLTRKERQKKQENWKIKKKESRERQNSQKKRRVREKDLRNWHKRKEMVSTSKLTTKARLRNTGNRDNKDKQLQFLDQTSAVMKEIVPEKILRKNLIHKFSFLKKYGLTKQLSKYTGLSMSVISRVAKMGTKRKKREDATSEEVRKTIGDFLQRKDNATILPASKRIKLDNKERMVLGKTMKSLYADFKESNPSINISLSTFKRNKPQNNETTKKQHWEGCLCEWCENVELKL